jgi:hypothetical protein
VEEIDERMLTGTWTAERDGGVAFELQLDRSGQFEWMAGEGRDGTNVAGDFEVNGQTLVLNGQKGETLMGHVTAVSDNRFKFKLLGSPPNDPGLEFVRR